MLMPTPSSSAGLKHAEHQAQDNRQYQAGTDSNVPVKEVIKCEQHNRKDHQGHNKSGHSNTPYKEMISFAR